MRITADRSDLLAALERARKVTPGAKDSAFSSHARIVTHDNFIKLFATDLTIFVACHVDADVAAEGDIGVMPADLAEMVRHLPEGDVSIETKDNGRATVKGGKRSFTLPFLDGGELAEPKGVSPPSGITIAGDVLASHLQRTVIAAYAQPDRAHMRGVAFDGRGESLKLAATDGLRVAVSDVDSLRGGGSVYLLHIAAARLIAAEAPKMGNVDVAIDTRGFSFASDSVDIFVPHVGVSFPPYEMAFPKKPNPTKAIVDAKEFASCVAAASVVSKTTQFDIGAVIQVAAAGDKLLAKDEVDAKIEGPSGTVYLAAALVLDVLKGATSPEVAMSIAGPKDGVLFETPGYRVFVLPIDPSAAKAAA